MAYADPHSLIVDMKASGEWTDAYQSAPGYEPLIRSLGPNVVGLEIGTCEAWNAVRWLDNCPNIARLDCVDPYVAYDDVNGGATQEQMDNLRAQAIMNLEPYQDRVAMFRMTSVEMAAGLVPAGPVFNFIFIDGQHTYEAVHADLQAWHPRVLPGGICGGHDFGLDCVRRAVLEFAYSLSYKPSVQQCHDGCWYWRVPAPGDTQLVYDTSARR